MTVPHSEPNPTSSGEAQGTHVGHRNTRFMTERRFQCPTATRTAPANPFLGETGEPKETPAQRRCRQFVCPSGSRRPRSGSRLSASASRCGSRRCVARHRADRAGGAAQHALGLAAHGVDFAGTLVDGHHGRLGEHDAAAADVDESVGGAQVDGDIARAKTCEEVEETDELLLSVWCGRSWYTSPQAAPNR
jgi:hypothetical protein